MGRHRAMADGPRRPAGPSARERRRRCTRGGSPRLDRRGCRCHPCPRPPGGVRPRHGGRPVLAVARAFRTDQKTEKTLAANAEFAAKNAVPADEAAGILDLNEMRMLCGLDPVLIDPKLHNAARDHSKDMATKNFFAHESPVPGKKSPWDRAKLAGTTASAENIFAGDQSPKGANGGWFHSPGHHVNMFGNHRRGGMGRYEGHWTQMFGG